LSRRRKAEGDIEEEEGAAEEWVDELLGMGVWVNSWWTQVQQESKDGRAKGEGGYERRRKGEKSERTKGEEGKEGKKESKEGGDERGRYLVQGALQFPVFALPGIMAADIGISRSVKDEEVDQVLEQVR
jgi:hypothetical protein